MKPANAPNKRSVAEVAVHCAQREVSLSHYRIQLVDRRSGKTSAIGKGATPAASFSETWMSAIRPMKNPPTGLQVSKPACGSATRSMLRPICGQRKAICLRDM